MMNEDSHRTTAPEATNLRPIVVRRGRPGDWPFLPPLLAELGRSELLRAERADRYFERFAEYLRRHDVVVLVAEAGGEIVGFLNFELHQRFTHDQPYAYVANIVTAASVRRRGVGRLLVAAAEAAARAKGCTSLKLDSALGRVGAHSFFVDEGFLETGKVFTKRLD